MIPHCSSRVRKWRLGAIAAASLLALPGSLLAGSPKQARPTGKTPGSNPGASALPRPDYADALPSSRPAAPDLLLTKDDERKAQAFATFAKGVIAEDNADTDTAFAEYRRSFDLDPSNTDIALRVAYMLMQRDDPSEGILVLKDNIKAAPKDPRPLVLLSQIYLRNLKKPDLALKYAEQALALGSNSFPAYAAVFEILEEQNQTTKAEQVLQRALKSTSADPQFWLSLGELYIRIHFKDDGTPDTPEALQQANVIFRKAGDLSKEDATTLAKVGVYFIRSKQIKDAIPFYSRAIALKPNSDDQALSNARENLARALTEVGNPGEAINVLEQVVKDNPLSFETYEQLGSLYEEEGNYAKALTNYQHSTLINSTNVQNHVHLAELQIQLKQFEDAVSTARAARSLFPDDPTTHVLLAVALGQAKHNTEAMTAFAEAKSEIVTDGHEEFLNANFYFQYGAAAEQSGLLDQAEDLFKESIKQDPKNGAQAYNYLGYMWAERGLKLDEAAEMIEKALALDPRNGAYLDSLGWVYFKKGDYAKALEELRAACDNMKPEDATVFDHLGDAYEKSGDIQEALRCWEKALALHQDDLDEKTVQAKIDGAKKGASAAAPTAQ